MPYCILETDEGWTIAETRPDGAAEELARELGATVIDPGPYDSYEEANDALGSLQGELAEENGASDTPGARILESRDED